MRRIEPDPADEHFDVVDSNGHPLEIVKSREQIHRDGDWHRSFHCWVVGIFEGVGPQVVFQRRSQWKDTHPGCLDVSVGGHYRAGEGFDEVVREIQEELGFQPDPSKLVQIGRRRAIGTGPTWLDREIQDVYVHVLEMPAKRLCPAYEEISALDLVDVDQLELLFRGEVSSVNSVRFRVQIDNTLGEACAGTLSVKDFIEVDDNYWLEGARAAVRVLSGERNVQLDLW